MNAFRCGHPRSPENTWSAGVGHRRCKQCRQAYKAGRGQRVFVGDGVTTFKACGHPKTQENSWSSGAYPRCKACHKPRIERWRKHGPMPQPQIARPLPQPDLSHDPAVLAYRAEKAKRVA